MTGLADPAGTLGRSDEITSGFPEAGPPRFESIDGVRQGLAGVGYIASRRIATALFMAQHLSKPVLVEGVAGVGKTELALGAAAMLQLPLIRLQCYEGLDESKALYEWKYGKQLLYTQILKDHMGAELAGAPDMAAAMDRLHGVGDLFYSDAFLEPRPLLQALRSAGGASPAHDVSRERLGPAPRRRTPRALTN